MKHILLGSKSLSRQQLLTHAHIPFRIIEQNADETKCNWGLPLVQLVKSIARHKMDSLVVPSNVTDDMCWVLTADTLSQDSTGVINGKPIDRADAIDKIKKARDGARLCTAFCLDKKQNNNGVWNTVERIEQQVTAEYVFHVSDAWIDTYLDNSLGYSASNAIAVEGFGEQFLSVVHGSYSAIIGLPMFEVRLALEKLGFFE